MRKKIDKSQKPRTQIRVEITHHTNGTVTSKSPYVNGKIHGLETGWDENGQKRRETMYRDGKFHGTSSWWNENGAKVWETYSQHDEEYSRMEWNEKRNVTRVKFNNKTAAEPNRRIKKTYQGMDKIEYA